MLSLPEYIEACTLLLGPVISNEEVQAKLLQNGSPSERDQELQWMAPLPP